MHYPLLIPHRGIIPEEIKKSTKRNTFKHNFKKYYLKEMS